MPSIIVGTAGHIDHGKSALVRALTGKDPDRLPEEKRRGITIDLGFADLDLDGLRIGFIDVPGHERFVRNMLAGAHGIDLVALVIAADEGVMPQTREHFDICRLLGVEKGVVVLTKADLVEEELLQLVQAEAEELVAHSFLEGAPVVPVSAKTGSGLNEFRRSLRDVAEGIPARSSDYVLRLPLDRAFTMKGFGVVVTGTLVSGVINEGDELELLPRKTIVRARGLQVHGQVVKQAVAGQRTAVNLGGIDLAAIERGMILAPPNRLQPTQIIDAQLTVLQDAPRPLRSRARLRMHIHAAESLGRIRVLNERNEIAPGETGFAQIRLDTPLVAIAGERFILRSYSPQQTVAGGMILDPFATKHRGRELARVEDRLHELSTEDRPTLAFLFVRNAGELGLRPGDLGARTAWNDDTVRKALAANTATGKIINCEGRFITRDKFTALSQLALAEVHSHHKREPLAKGLGRETLREKHFPHVPAEVFRAVLAQLEQQQKIVLEKDLVRAPEHSRELSGADAQLQDRLREIYQHAGLQAPSIEEAFGIAGLKPQQHAHGRKVLQLLIESSVLVKVQNDLFFDRQALQLLQDKLRSYGQRESLIDVATFKELAGVSRKYAIPLLEYLDRERITRREGDRRRILN